MLNKEILTHFTKNVDNYDYVAYKVVMNNDKLHDQLVKGLDFNRNDELKILDLGCGTGHGMLLILDKYPNAVITGIDFSSNMIKKSKENLVSFSDRIELLEKDFNEEGLGKNFDAIVSAITIHNSTHEQKKELFKKIYDSLKDGGAFINADFIEGETEEIDSLYRELYREYLKSNLAGEELEVWLNHSFNEDKPMKLTEQFDLLKKIGFKEISLICQLNNLAVYFAQK